MSNLTLSFGNTEDPLEIKTLIFPGGEPHVEIKHPEALFLSTAYIEAHIKSMDDFGLLLALTDAVRRCEPKEIFLYIPYFPGARQDRYEPGFAITATVFADIINMQNYDGVAILDPHSSVVPALISNCRVADHLHLVKQFVMDKEIVGLICPDAGAEKRTMEAAKYLKINNIFYARKMRDPKTGALSHFHIDNINIPGKLLIVDDICDGGGTFVGLAKEIRRKHNNPLYLWTTHGIYSKGLDDLLLHFEGVGCSNSFPFEGTHPRFERLNNLKGHY